MAHSYVSDVKKVADQVLTHVQPTLDELTGKLQAEIATLKQELEQTRTESLQAQKDMQRFKICLDAMRPMLTRFGEYTFMDGRKAIGIITRAFEVARTVDVVAFDNGGSGGVYEIEGKTVGSGREQFQPFLSYEEEEEDGAGDDSASSEEADTLVAA